MACNTTCCKCGDKFDRFSGKLINLSDESLKVFYSLPFIKNYLNNPEHKHPTLCAKCLEELLGRKLLLSDFKFKNYKGQKYWYSSNEVYLLSLRLQSGAITLETYNKLSGLVKSFDDQGIATIPIFK